MKEADLYNKNELIATTFLPPFDPMPDVLSWQNNVYVRFDHESNRLKYRLGMAFQVADQYVAAPRLIEDKANVSEKTKPAEVPPKLRSVKGTGRSTGRRKKN